MEESRRIVRVVLCTTVEMEVVGPAVEVEGVVREWRARDGYVCAGGTLNTHIREHAKTLRVHRDQRRDGE